MKQKCLMEGEEGSVSRCLQLCLVSVYTLSATSSHCTPATETADVMPDLNHDQGTTFAFRQWCSKRDLQSIVMIWSIRGMPVRDMNVAELAILGRICFQDDALHFCDTNFRFQMSPLIDIIRFQPL